MPVYLYSGRLDSDVYPVRNPPLLPPVPCPGCEPGLHSCEPPALFPLPAPASGPAPICVPLQTVMRAVAQQFVNLSAAVRTEFTVASAHAWIVDEDTCADGTLPES